MSYIAAPTKERFESLDVLRGVAVLGIFAVNIGAMPSPRFIFKTRHSIQNFLTPPGKHFGPLSPSSSNLSSSPFSPRCLVPALC